MRSELIGIRLPLHNAAVIRRRAADIGLTKSAFAANLVLRGLNSESVDRLPTLLDRLDDTLERLEAHLDGSRNGSAQAGVRAPHFECDGQPGIELVARRPPL